MKSAIFYVVALCILVSSCKKHWATRKVCGGKLYVEAGKMDVVGVTKEYLTDSANFRLLIGTRDEEQENYSYACHGDSISITKSALNDSAIILVPVSIKHFRLDDLVSRKVSEFDF